MERQYDIFKVKGADFSACTLTEAREEGDLKVYTFDLDWDVDKVTEETEFEFTWDEPVVGILYGWSFFNGFNRSISADWGVWHESKISTSAPIYSFYDADGVNHCTWALSECAKRVLSKVNFAETRELLECEFRLPVKQFTNCGHTQISIYIDYGKKPFYEAISQTGKWWENDCGITPAFTPEIAKDSLYSFWYSHHKDITDVLVEEECKRAKELGFSVCIVDDGWQTEDEKWASYIYCGDWEPAKNKFPDMAAHVQRVHEIGMKYILWFSVPFLGYKAKKFEQFKDMILHHCDWLEAAVLDPRYREVREYLVGIYKNAVLEWNLDGLKLDFIDLWYEGKDSAPYCSKMDIPALTDAVDSLMTEIITTLREINPDIMIEFRQSYNGPVMRKFGNMFRVADCPNAYLTNRLGVLDLRMLQEGSAVHSDMLMWNPQEEPENAAMQIISVLFGTLQYSARIENMTQDMRKMAKFWTTFKREHKHLLLEAPLALYEPQFLYSWVKASENDECVVAVYGNDTCVKPDDTAVIYIANGTGKDRIIAELNGMYEITVQNCLGDPVSTEMKQVAGITGIAVPRSGLVTLKKQVD